MNALVSCPHCAHQVHESAPTCPQCGAARMVNTTAAVSYASYDQVPWYRKRWFAFVCVFVFMPLFLLIAFTGNVYFQKDDELKTIPPNAKFIVLGIFIVMVLIRMNG
ncbi:hypothetical protein [Herbaspirillum hiltneri]|nr:hypothetical protein [Herbaspirillum hiltneri]